MAPKFCMGWFPWSRERGFMTSFLIPLFSFKLKLDHVQNIICELFQHLFLAIWEYLTLKKQIHKSNILEWSQNDNIIKKTVWYNTKEIEFIFCAISLILVSNLYNILGIWLQFEMAKGYLKSITGRTIIDASCGSGLFSRLFAKSGMFSLVIALDFSENMLQQCYHFINQEGVPRE